MPLTTKEAVLATAPELAKLAGAEWDATWAQALADVSLEVSEDVWGESTELASRLLVAHTLLLSHPHLQARQVVSVSALGVSKTYASGAAPTSALDGTPYGQRFARLALQLLGTGFVL